MIIKGTTHNKALEVVTQIYCDWPGVDVVISQQIINLHNGEKQGLNWLEFKTHELPDIIKGLTEAYGEAIKRDENYRAYCEYSEQQCKEE